RARTRMGSRSSCFLRWRHGSVIIALTCVATARAFAMATPDEPADDVFWPGGGLREELLCPSAAGALREAMRLARETRWDSLRSPPASRGLPAGPAPRARAWGARLRADLPKLLGQFQELFHQDDGEPEPVVLLHREFLSDNVIRLLREAYN